MAININFGCAAGEQEGIDYPELVEKGYFDNNSIIKSIVEESKFLILGTKGSGKSLTGEKLKILQDKEKDRHLVTSVQHLASFPFSDFAKILSVTAESKNNYTETWKFLLLALVINSFSSDPNGKDTENIEFRNSVRALQEHGIIHGEGINKILKKSAKKSFKIAIPQFLEFLSEENKERPNYEEAFFELINHLIEVVSNFFTISSHIIVIDGLDDFLNLKELQNNVISCLIYEVEQINKRFKSSKIPVKFVVLCRTDIYEKLELPNKNKTKRDLAIELNWYQDPRNPENSNLIKLIEQRAASQSYSEFFSKYLPSRAGGHENKEIRHYLLDHTRHTPRDFTQLMNSIVKFSNGDKISRDEMLSGLADYSVEYFLPEIKDELVGHVDDFNLFEKIISAIKTINQREFLCNILMQKLDPEISHADILGCLTTMFNCGAIGHKWNVKGFDDNRYEFRYRNRNATFDKDKTIVLHKGLWKALNLI